MIQIRGYAKFERTTDTDMSWIATTNYTIYLSMYVIIVFYNLIMAKSVGRIVE